MKQTPQRALVTGGAGFVGSALVDRLLAEGYVVDVVDDLSSGTLKNLSSARSSGGAFTFHRVDVRSEDLISLIIRRAPQVIFHLATQPSDSQSHLDPAEDAHTNIIGSLRVLEGARQANANKVIVSSCAPGLYGNEDVSMPLNEKALQLNGSPRRAAYKAVHDYLETYRNLHALEFTCLLLGDVYGPQRDVHARQSVVSTFAGALQKGESPVIDGDGEQTRDFVFVDDVVDGFARAAKRGTGLIANIGTGVETSINELWRQMCRVADVVLTPHTGVDRKHQVRRRALDASRAKLHLGWRPFTSLDDGLQAVLLEHAETFTTGSSRR